MGGIEDPCFACALCREKITSVPFEIECDSQQSHSWKRGFDDIDDKDLDSDDECEACGDGGYLLQCDRCLVWR